MSEVTIGRARLTDPAFLFHVAGLAKPDQVRSGVCSIGASEVAERHNVVDGQGVAHMLAAMPAFAALFGNNDRAHLIPAFAPIGGYPTNVAWGFFGGEHAGSLKAFPFAKASKPILAGKPRLLAKRIAAMLAVAFNSALPAWMLWPRNPRLKGIRGRNASAPFVSDFVVVGHGAVSHVPLAPALLAAKPSGRCAIRADSECMAAYFANDFRHIGTITGTTGVAIAQKQGDMFIDPPAPKPVQQQLLGDAA